MRPEEAHEHTPLGPWFTSSYSGSHGECVEVAHISASFRKSSHSGRNTNCVEVAHLPAQFRKSSHSAAHGECVEIAALDNGAAMRDTKNRELGALAFDAPEWRAFLNTTRRDAR
ncbi:DUF397 domain-containing protein [Nocardiopsis synnemataformans]|uniref:DUF397 domain-containing protein n=1 Tax=Nocardiopsis synnemataformans TaxID=61305 RepID=UPI003EBBE212